jgi:glycosyltransferase involved in cell wall biosynthesis
MNLNFDIVIIRIKERIDVIKKANLIRERRPDIPIMVIGDYYHSFDFNLIKRIQGFGQVKIFPLVTTDSLKIIEAVNSLLNPNYPSKTENIAIVLPVYNEEERFHNVINFAKKLLVFLEQGFFNARIYFINDGSSDNTNKLVIKLIEEEQELSKYISDQGFISIKELKENTRKAGTYIEGIKNIECDIMIFADADDSFDIDDIAKMANILREGYYDMVVGSKDFTAEKRSPVRKLLSFAKRLLTKSLLPNGVYDAQTGLKAIKMETAKYIFPYLQIEQGLAIDLEMLYLAKRFRFRVLQMQVKCIDRDGSHVDIVKDSIRYLHSIMKISFGNYNINRRDF